MTSPSAADSFQQNGLFSDKRYPRGLSRSGIFTLGEAQILERHGNAFQALSSGTCAPRNEEEQRFIDVAHGRETPVTPAEKVWMKYQKTLSRRSYTLTSSNRSNSGDDDDGSVDTSLDLD
ncbi:MAG: DUF413 domain-containing protein [Ferrimonas sp.]